MDSDEFHNQVALEYYRSGIQVVREIGIMALRTLITLNSGAFVVLLTFIGNTAAQSKFTVPLPNSKFSMYFFLIGLALSFVAIAYTYIVSQKASPYPQEPKQADGWFVPIVVIVTALSFVSFLLGVVSVVRGVEVT